ncbi:MAG: hypothetical protein JXB26_02710 [Candidatus Aminicenantes bacterium]|nr:hypothetical protein [Candidatus Aminicenantes bacterium]
MKLKIFTILLLAGAPLLMGFVYPQGGIESWVGANRLMSLTPWLGFRFGLTNTMSLTLKYSNQNIHFDYESSADLKERRKATISQFSLVFYSQKTNREVWSSLSYFRGSDHFDGLAIDAGVIHSLTSRLKLVNSLYILKEKSTLWFPDEDQRDIFAYSLRTGLQFRFFKWLQFNPNVYVGRTSKDVTTFSFSVGFILSPKDPIMVTVYYFRYREAALYQFTGDYVSVGLNYYY